MCHNNLIVPCNIAFLVFLPMILFGQAKPTRSYVPVDKNLDSQWVQSLYQKGDRKVYQGNELTHLAMPCGGIGAGQVEITGDGTLCFTESVYNQVQSENANGGLGWNNGAQYLHPQVPKTKIENGFAIRIKEEEQEPQVFQLSYKDFDDLHFIGEYPMATLVYRKTGANLPVEIQAEVFSPFVPLDLRSSTNPVTILRFSVTNTTRKTVDVMIAGWMQNATFPKKGENKVNKVVRGQGLTGILFSSQPELIGDKPPSEKVQGKEILRGNGSPQWGDLCISVLDEKANTTVSSISAEEYLYALKQQKVDGSENKIYASNETGGGGVASDFKLAPYKTKTLTFLVTWYFPNLSETSPDAGSPGLVGHFYNNWYTSSFDVAKYVSSNFNQLYNDTKLFHDTYFDNTLPYWLANRISMPVSALASGTISIWENGRMFGYEGIGFCPGTTGHVYNFVTAISKLFPGLERSVRLMQDLNDSAGFSQSGRINIRGLGTDGLKFKCPDDICRFQRDQQDIVVQWLDQVSK